MSGIVSSQAMNFESKNLEIVKELENLKINEDQNQRDIESLKNHIENELESDIISEFIEKQADLSRKFNKTIEQNEKAIKDVLAVQKQFISTSKSEVSLWCLLLTCSCLCPCPHFYLRPNFSYLRPPIFSLADFLNFSLIKLKRGWSMIQLLQIEK